MQQEMTAMQAYRASLASCIASQDKWRDFLDFAAFFSMSESQKPFGFAAQLCVYGSEFRSSVCLTEDDWAEYERYPISDDDFISVLSMACRSDNAARSCTVCRKHDDVSALQAVRYRTGQRKHGFFVSGKLSKHH